MSRNYFSADWIVERIDSETVTRVYQIARELNTYVYELDADGMKGGYYYSQWFISAESHDIALSLFNQLSPYLNLVDLKGASEEQFSYAQIANLSYSGRDPVLSIQRGQYNHALKYGKPMWATANWCVYHISVGTVHRLLDILTEYQYSLRYFEPQHDPVSTRDFIQIFIEAKPVDRMQSFVDKLPEFFSVIPWNWLYAPVDNIPMPLSLDTLNFAASKVLSRESVVDFLRKLRNLDCLED